MAGFFQYPAEILSFVGFAELVGPQLIKKGRVSDLMKQIRKTTVVKANVTYVERVNRGGPVKLSSGGRTGTPVPVKKITIQDAIDQIQKKFTISEEEAIIIREVTEEKIQDEKILNTIRIHREDESFIRDTYKDEVDRQIQQAYEDRNRYENLWDPKYLDAGAIFDIMAYTVIENGFQAVMAE
jgi:type I restriction enzyme R subunit